MSLQELCRSSDDKEGAFGIYSEDGVPLLFRHGVQVGARDEVGVPCRIDHHVQPPDGLLDVRYHGNDFIVRTHIVFTNRASLPCSLTNSTVSSASSRSVPG